MKADKDLMERDMLLSRELYDELMVARKRIHDLEAQPRLAREAIDRYCPPDLYASARNWLRKYNL